MTSAESNTLQDAITARAREFDLGALLALLQSNGFDDDDIRFGANMSNVSQRSLVHSVTFFDDPRRVRICLNLGLLGPQSPVPSYFFKHLEEGNLDPDHFVGLVAFLDHGVLWEFVRAAYPEVDTRVFPDWERYKRRELQMLNLRSTTTLTWLFSSVFPDLTVAVEKVVARRKLDTGHFRVGHSSLGGDFVIGRTVRLPIQSRRVVLVSESERTPAGEPWPVECRRRIDAVIRPILASVGVDLEVELEVRAQESWVQLHKDSFLGYDPMRGKQARYRRIRISAGYITT